MTIHCCFCWSLATPDGCGFICNNLDCVTRKDKGIVDTLWISGDGVFDTKKEGYGVKPNEI